MALQESGEMYLEAVYVLSKKQPVVHSVDVAEYLGYSKPSVSRAVGLLKNGGYLTSEHGGALHLTDAGREIGHKIFERHKVLTRCLMALGVDVATAAEDACRLEHAISDVSFTAIKEHLEKAGLLD
ncbi:MAG: metal-dependent transcriptional regulator [Oscillospiraceae bacterium]|nr:metal-dependent transcriptional regulator [Oscillospiraceae bacterium]